MLLAVLSVQSVLPGRDLWDRQGAARPHSAELLITVLSSVWGECAEVGLWWLFDSGDLLGSLFV